MLDADNVNHRYPPNEESERRRRRKFTTSIPPAKAYEDESVIMSGPH